MNSRHVSTLFAIAALGFVLTGCEAKVSVGLAASGFGSADQVNLVVDSVEMLDDSSAEHELDAGGDAINGLDYTDGDSATLTDGKKLANGRYTGLRLQFGDGSALYASDGSEYPIDTSNGSRYADIDVELGDKDTADLITILETRFSLYPSTSQSGHYTLTPVLRVVRSDRSGSIGGSVDEDLVRSTACRQNRTLGTGVSVYAYVGANITPTDFVQNQGGGPVASADVAVSSDSSSFTFNFPFLAAGTYTLAVTCNADSENPTTNDGLTFLTTASVVLSESESESVTLSE